MRLGSCLEWDESDVINQFRIGNYADADEEVQHAWIRFLGDILPTISKVWAQDVIQKSRAMKDVVNTATEAFALWVIKHEYEGWVHITETEETGGMVNAKKKYKRIGPHMSTQFLNNYSEIYGVVAANRQVDTSWDIGYTNALQNAEVIVDRTKLMEALVIPTPAKRFDTIVIPIGNYGTIQQNYTAV